MAAQQRRVVIERTSENPMIALSGVRSSCDMFARNSDFIRLACSATFFCWSVCSKR